MTCAKVQRANLDLHKPVKEQSKAEGFLHYKNEKIFVFFPNGIVRKLFAPKDLYTARTQYALIYTFHLLVNPAFSFI